MSAVSPATDLPGLDSDTIRRWAGTWDDGGLWGDVEVLADRFWTSADGTERLTGWHHLVLAVGNFKRESGRRLRPAWLPLPLTRPAPRSSSVLLPGTESPLLLGVDDVNSWIHLNVALPGAAVATTTTLLAALWPDRHFVFDWRVHAAANGLRIYAGSSTTVGVQAGSAAPLRESLDAYALVRDWVLAAALTTGTTVTEAERTLYQLSRGVPDVPTRTWWEYGKALASLAD